MYRVMSCLYVFICWVGGWCAMLLWVTTLITCTARAKPVLVKSLVPVLVLALHSMRRCVFMREFTWNWCCCGEMCCHMCRPYMIRNKSKQKKNAYSRDRHSLHILVQSNVSKQAQHYRLVPERSNKDHVAHMWKHKVDTCFINLPMASCACNSTRHTKTCLQCEVK